MRRLFPVFLILASHIVQAETPSPIEGITTIVEQKQHGLSEADVKQMNEISSAISNGDKETAFLKLKPILAGCEARETTLGKAVISVDSVAEFLEYVASQDKKKDVIWMKDSCPQAYKTAAFLYVEQGDKQNAFNYLDLAAKAAPFWAEPYTERGYLLGKLGEFKPALEAYQKAITLAETHESSSYLKPLALRGLGFVLVEMGELDRAKAAYEESLKLEPNNKLAQGELEYIQRRQAEK
jgi:tetratricopeptide (TPR) repeat protein